MSSSNDHQFDDVGIGGARLNQRSAERFEELIAIERAGAVFGNLAGAARDDVLVALATTLRVVRGSEPIARRFDFFEDEAVIVE